MEVCYVAHGENDTTLEMTHHDCVLCLSLMTMTSCSDPLVLQRMLSARPATAKPAENTPDVSMHRQAQHDAQLCEHGCTHPCTIIPGPKTQQAVLNESCCDANALPQLLHALQCSMSLQSCILDVPLQANSTGFERSTWRWFAQLARAARQNRESILLMRILHVAGTQLNLSRSCTGELTTRTLPIHCLILGKRGDDGHADWGA